MKTARPLPWIPSWLLWIIVVVFMFFVAGSMAHNLFNPPEWFKHTCVFLLVPGFLAIWLLDKRGELKQSEPDPQENFWLRQFAANLKEDHEKQSREVFEAAKREREAKK